MGTNRTIVMRLAVALAAVGLSASTLEAASCAPQPILECNNGAVCTQRIDLVPGWNAVYLEVQPEPDDIDVVLAGIPVESVWTPNPQQSTIDFVQDPSDEELSATGWLGYRPAGGPGAFLTNLFRVNANRPYLVKVSDEAGTPAELCWSVTGRPSLRRATWLPNSFNLVGMAIDPAASVSFGDFFASSPAHAGQAVFRLTPGEQVWREVGCADPATCTTDEQMRSGEAFWIYSSGASDYSGPMHVVLQRGDGLDFGQSVQELAILLENRSDEDHSYTVRMLTGDPSLVAYRKVSNTVDHPVESSYPGLPSFPAGLTVPDDLTDPTADPAGPGEQVPVRLTVRRRDFPSDAIEGIIEISDGAGSRRLIPLSAGLIPGATDGSGTYAGLWMGTVTLDEVAEVHSDPQVLTPVANPFSFRLIVHVDESGQARLLDDVIQMWQDGIDNLDPTPDIPGHLVLVTRDDKIPDFKGVALVDDELVGRRASSPAFAFDSSSGPAWEQTTETLTMQPSGGGFAEGGTLGVAFVLGHDSASNPFFHRYHDQHDGDAANPVHADVERYEIERVLTLDFAASDPFPDMDGNVRPDWGDKILGGAYGETMTIRDAPGSTSGLTLTTAGTFELRRVTDQGVLNQ